MSEQENNMTKTIEETKPTETEAPKRKMSDEHRRRISEAHRQREVISAYLDAVGAPKRRGRRISTEELRDRLSSAEQEMQEATGVDRLKVAQSIIDLQERITEQEQAELTQQLLGEMEKRFIEVAADYAERHKISRQAWREVGVPAKVLKDAGIRN